MFARLTGTLAAAAFALTTLGAAPVQADRQDTARIAAALLGIAAIAKIIHDKNDRDDTRSASRDRPVHQPHVYRNDYYGQRYDPVNRGGLYPRPVPPRVHDRRAKLLPQECFRSFETRKGPRHIFGRRCLKRNFRHVNSLPQACAVKFRSHGNTYRGYGARCLRRAGYALARG